MKIRLTWDEYKELAQCSIKDRYPTATNVWFGKKYSYEPESDHYEFPDFIEFTIE